MTDDGRRAGRLTDSGAARGAGRRARVGTASGLALSLAVALALALVVVAVAPRPAQAGAWTREPGSVYLRLATKAYQADEIFDGDGDRISGDWWDPEAEFREFSLNLIGEVGILPWLTGTVETTAKLMHSDYSAGSGGAVRVDGFSDVLLGLRWGFWQRQLVAAVETRIEIPTGYPQDQTHVRLGTGYVNGQFKLLFGGGLPLGFGNYFDTSFGYRVRGGPFEDDLLASAAVGVETFERLWVRAGFSGVFNLGESETLNLLTAGNQDASYIGVGGALTYLFGPGFGVELAGSADVWGRNTFAGWGLELVLQWES